MAPCSLRDLRAAVVVGVLLAAVFLGSLAWHPAAFTATVVVLVVAGLVEAAAVLRSAGQPVAVPVVVVAALVMVVGAYGAGATGQVLGVVALFVGLSGWHLVDVGRREVMTRTGPSLLLGLWVGLLASFAPLLVTREPDGAVALLATVGAAVLTDIGGWAVGSAVGRHRLAPRISPHKTWEGLAGGVALAVLVAVALLPRLSEAFDPVAAAGVAVLASLATMVGDLIESMIKRDAGVKDLGRLLPGHGGILDRFDGILLALPVGYYATRLLV